MTELTLFLLILFQIKHWLVDFAFQTRDELDNKGKYGKWLGIKHSLKHGIGTFFIIWAITGWNFLFISLLIGFFDLVVHYHIDWIKTNYSNKDISNPKYWNHLGLDQMAHQLTYIIITGAVVL